MAEIKKKDILISTDKRKLQIKVIHNFLTESYWCSGIPLDVIKTQIKNSFCVGVYIQKEQVGFARVVTDYASHAYLCDVFILESHRGKGLSKLLMEFIFKHPKLKKIRAWKLATRDAHGLYAKFGFTPETNPERLMIRKTKTW